MNKFLIALVLTYSYNRALCQKLLREGSSIMVEPDYFDFIRNNTPASAKLNFYLDNPQLALKRAETIVNVSEKSNIKILSILDSDFPDILRHIDNPPLVLNVKGNLQVLTDRPGVAIIGTRKPSRYGIECANELGSIYGRLSVNVVSGLAIGCDTGAHVGCLNVKGTTTAVLATGLDRIYPPENHSLVEKILENNGCILSEYFVRQKVSPYMFVERDRLQAGLSQFIIVIETDIKGGSMHTVRFGINNKRPIVCLAYPAEWSVIATMGGNRDLLRSGKAKPLQVVNMDGTRFNQEDIELLNGALLRIPDIAKTNIESQVTVENVSAPFLHEQSPVHADKPIDNNVPVLCETNKLEGSVMTPTTESLATATPTIKRQTTKKRGKTKDDINKLDEYTLKPTLEPLTITGPKTKRKPITKGDKVSKRNLKINDNPLQGRLIPGDEKDGTDNRS